MKKYTHKNENIQNVLLNDKYRIMMTKMSMLNDIRGGGNNESEKSKSIEVNDEQKHKTNRGLQNIGKLILYQYRQRVAADPSFLQKSILEVFLAAGTQLTAEVGKRGLDRIIPEIDFVIAGLFTAIAGKYYSMWKVAPTKTDSKVDEVNDHKNASSHWRSKIPTNAFQATLLDGKTKPALLQRMTSFLVPMPSLFQAGFIASTIGYGFTAILISLRSILIPTYEAATVNINIIHACVYTGLFMAFVSNIRYQLLQGLIEPKIIERIFSRFPLVRAIVIFTVRLMNGLLGSTLAITGMKLLGLQKLK